MKLTLTDIALRLVAPLAALASLTGCNGLIYDDEGDCDPYYKVKFVYDTNLKFTDAFAAEVSEVTLYVVDPATGNIVWQRHEEGEALRSGNYMMDVDVAPGTYDLIAWCGEGHTSSFTVADATVREGLRCRLTDREAAPAEGEAHVRNELRRLFHGKSDFLVLLVYIMKYLRNRFLLQIIVKRRLFAYLDKCHNVIKEIVLLVSEIACGSLCGGMETDQTFHRALQHCADSAVHGRRGFLQDIPVIISHGSDKVDRQCLIVMIVGYITHKERFK